MPGPEHDMHTAGEFTKDSSKFIVNDEEYDKLEVYVFQTDVLFSTSPRIIISPFAYFMTS
jgi:hypothetical protein